MCTDIPIRIEWCLSYNVSLLYGSCHLKRKGAVDLVWFWRAVGGKEWKQRLTFFESNSVLWDALSQAAWRTKSEKYQRAPSVGTLRYWLKEVMLLYRRQAGKYDMTTFLRNVYPQLSTFNCLFVFPLTKIVHNSLHMLTNTSFSLAYCYFWLCCYAWCSLLQG